MLVRLRNLALVALVAFLMLGATRTVVANIAVEAAPRPALLPASPSPSPARPTARDDVRERAHGARGFRVARWLAVTAWNANRQGAVLGAIWLAVAHWRAALPPPVVHTETAHVVPPSTPPPVVGGNCESLIRQVWGSVADWAIGIAHRESGCTAGATSPDGARGVFQLLGHVDDGCAYDMECNIRAAWSLYQQCHEGPWTAPNYGCW